MEGLSIIGGEGVVFADIPSESVIFNKDFTMENIAVMPRWLIEFILPSPWNKMQEAI